MVTTDKVATRPAIGSPKGPTNEVGYGNYGGWGGFIFDPAETSPDLQWPLSIYAYDKMRRIDSKVYETLAAICYPVIGTTWRIDPRNASEEATNLVANDLGLPILGVKSSNVVKGSARRETKRLSWSRYMRQALLSLSYGHMFHEKVGAIGPDGYYHLTRLAPRMPRTIAKINQTRQGDLVSIQQWPNYWPSAPTMEDPIPADRLVFNLHEPEGDLLGNSLLRRAFRPYTLKDRLLRVDAMMAERNGMGIPWVEAPPGASEPDLKAYLSLAQQYRAGSTSGAALPSGAVLHIQGVEGTLPNLLPAIQYHDEQIAAIALAEFLKLGSSGTGSRAVGDVFVDFFVLALAAVVAEQTETANAQIVDWLIDINFGPDEPAPHVMAQAVGAEHEVTADGLYRLMMSRALTPDPAIEDHVRELYGLPERKTPWVQPGFAPMRRPMGPELDANGDPIVVPENELDDLVPLNASAHRHVQAAGAIPAGHSPATGFVSLPDRPLHRQPTAIEAASGTDFRALDANRDSYAAEAAKAWTPIRSAQIDELVKAVRTNAAAPADLAGITLEAPDGSVLVPALTAAAQSGQAGALAEATHQGVTIPALAEDALSDVVSARARAVASLLTSRLTASATNKAVQLSGGPLSADALADAVSKHLNGLKETYEAQQLGGAVQASMNAGRIATMAAGPGATYYASEIGDVNTCAPCLSIDGTQYPTLDAATVDYPAGGYSGCLGGPLCRGTLVAVWPDEVAPTS